MKKKDFGDYFYDILESIDETEEFVRGMSFEDFLETFVISIKICRKTPLFKLE